MKISRQCLNCGKPFTTYISKERVKRGHGKFCSRDCSHTYIGKDRIGRPKIVSRSRWPDRESILSNGTVIYWNNLFRKNNHFWVDVACGRCSQTRTIPASDTRRQTFTGYCQKCSKEISHKTGADHHSWEGGKRIDSNGYVCVHTSNLSGHDLEIALPMAKIVHGKSSVIHEHRLVMGIHLDRPLLVSEVVHHKNGIKTDNRVSNLEIVSHAEHRQLDVKYYKLWQEALEDIRILKERITILESIETPR